MEFGANIGLDLSGFECARINQILMIIITIITIIIITTTIITWEVRFPPSWPALLSAHLELQEVPAAPVMAIFGNVVRWPYPNSKICTHCCYLMLVWRVRVLAGLGGGRFRLIGVSNQCMRSINWSSNFHPDDMIDRKKYSFEIMREDRIGKARWPTGRLKLEFHKGLAKSQ